MSPAQVAWLQAYSTILAGLLVGLDSPAYKALREIAIREANAACAHLGVSVS